MKRYEEAGYASMAWSIYMSPCNKCSCGRKGFWYSMFTKHVFIMYREKWKPWKTTTICGKCSESHLESLPRAGENANI
jgi:hypothetical protein